MPTTTDTTLVQREISIEASPETIWEFLVEDEKAIRWMGVAAELDPRPGGEYRVEVLPGEVARGEFVELDPPRRLVWTWGWEPSGMSEVAVGSTTIEIDLVPDGDRTTLRFVHRGMSSADEAGRHAHGWDHYLPRLAAAAGGEDPGRDPWLDRAP